jgi:hypothetical protein
MQIKSQHKDTISEFLTEILLNIANLQGYYTTEKSRSLLRLIQTEVEGSRLLRNVGNRLQIVTV